MPQHIFFRAMRSGFGCGSTSPAFPPPPGASSAAPARRIRRKWEFKNRTPTWSFVQLGYVAHRTACERRGIPNPQGDKRRHADAPRKRSGPHAHCPVAIAHRPRRPRFAYDRFLTNFWSIPAALRTKSGWLETPLNHSMHNSAQGVLCIMIRTQTLHRSAQRTQAG